MLAGIFSEIGGGGDLVIQTVILFLLESFYYQIHILITSLSHTGQYQASCSFISKKLCLPIRNPCFLSLFSLPASLSVIN